MRCGRVAPLAIVLLGGGSGVLEEGGAVRGRQVTPLALLLSGGSGRWGGRPPEFKTNESRSKIEDCSSVATATVKAFLENMPSKARPRSPHSDCMPKDIDGAYALPHMTI